MRLLSWPMAMYSDWGMAIPLRSICFWPLRRRTRESPRGSEPAEVGGAKVRVLLSTYGSRGDVEPMVGLAVRLRALGVQVRVCAPPDEEFERRLAGVGVP